MEMLVPPFIFIFPCDFCASPSKGLCCSVMDFFPHPPVRCLHLSHTQVANSSPRENEEPLIGFEGISSRGDRGEENSLATRPRSLHDYKYPRAPHLLRGGKTWGFINCNPPRARCVHATEAGHTVSKGRGLSRLPSPP